MPGQNCALIWSNLCCFASLRSWTSLRLAISITGTPAYFEIIYRFNWCKLQTHIHKHVKLLYWVWTLHCEYHFQRWLECRPRWSELVISARLWRVPSAPATAHDTLMTPDIAHLSYLVCSSFWADSNQYLLSFWQTCAVQFFRCAFDVQVEWTCAFRVLTANKWIQRTILFTKIYHW